MAFPPPDATTGFKCILFFNEGVFGWQEVYYLHEGNNTFLDAALDMRTIAKARKQLLTKSASIVGIRIQQFNRPEVGSQLLVKPSDGCGPGLVDPGLVGDQPVWNAILFNIADLSNLYRRQFLMRGFPSSFAEWSPAGVVTITADGTRPVQLWVNLMVQGPAVPLDLRLNGTIMIRGRYRDPVVTFPRQITGGAPDTTGCFTNLTVGSANYAVGDKIHIHNLQGCGTKGLNGDGFVVAIPDETHLTVNRVPCCCGAYTVKPTGTLTKVTYALWAISSCGVSRVVKRDTGRPFFSTRGRRSTCRR